MQEVANKALEQVIGKMGDLPALPGVVAEVLQLTEDPNSAMSDVTRVIQSDPALTAKILRLSNSSYYGMRQQVGTLKLALVILGVREVRNIVLGISVFETLKERSNVEVAQQIWADSLCVAGVARQLASTMGVNFQGEEFVAGLLSDIGKMVLLRQLKQNYLPLFNMFRHQPRMLLANETMLAGYTHVDAAAALAVRWSLPRTLSDTLWHQYPHEDRPLMLAKDPRLAATVRLAKAACMEDPALPEEQQPPEDTEAWKVLSCVKIPVQAEDRRSTMRTVKGLIQAGEALEL